VTYVPPLPRVAGEPPALSLRHLSKRFGGAHALNDVSLDVRPGEVLGLLGQNGSGKSTLIKILSGYHVPEPGGELLIHGEPVPLPVPPGTTEKLGLAFVHQHLGLVPSLTVLENLRMNTIASQTRWWMNWRRETARARETFARFGLSINPDARIADLPQVERALVAIVRAFESVQAEGRAQAGILVLDEPTPFLPKAGVDQLFGLVRAIVRERAAVIFVSHDVDEVREITDRAAVLRDGVLAGTLVTKDATHADFVELIVGQRVDLFHTTPHDLSGRPIAVAVRSSSGGALDNVSVEVREGEILGLAGLIGSGFDDLPYLIYGARPASGGTLRIAGGPERRLADMTPAAAMDARLALLPSDRLGAAGVGVLSVVDNVSLPVLNEFRGLLLNWPAIFGRAVSLGNDYQVRPNRPEMNLASLSGGNQQKALMAKWLQTEPRMLMLDEPTQGVDVGARQHLFAMLADAASRGIAVLVASTDYEQLEQICDRVLIFARGTIVAQLEGAAISKANIAEQCLRSTNISATLTAKPTMERIATP
jgi:ribose transport system ATP-binding protein